MTDRIGSLRERVTIQQKTPTTDSHGGRAEVWSDLATVWANVAGLNGAERFQAQAVESNVSWIAEIRYRADVTASMRLSWTPFRATSAKTLEIHAVRPKHGERERLLLDCGEVS